MAPAETLRNKKKESTSLLKPAPKLSKLEKFLQDKLDSGEVSACLALLPKSYMQLSDSDWDYVQEIIQEQRDE